MSQATDTHSLRADTRVDREQRKLHGVPDNTLRSTYRDLCGEAAARDHLPDRHSDRRRAYERELRDRDIDPADVTQQRD